MDYKIAYGKDADTLERAVESLLVLGWVPVGGLAINVLGELYQAMTRTTDGRVAAKHLQTAGGGR